ncbi:DUF2306 domain-containing protein [Spirosoma sp. BT702]|uniref:DUF2306 domain-containing protein n=1 Tax=Spirosoma profusum TaxID=2771354 RepID=A0A926XT84_9BACT|nr:DUF2306 domain-containing protein [Spirosoma profusum]MBD2699799.1 DUF2306 domain-containing protein [Spirosoma profusum]
MKTLVTSLLILHIATGSIALLVGMIPMFSKKGSRLHNRAGLVYVYCMITVAITALLLCALQPLTMMRLFLTGIAVFSFYLSMSGWRATKQKKSGPTVADRVMMYTTLAVSLAMISMGVNLMSRPGNVFFPVLFTFFGVLTAVFATQDIQRLRKPTEKMHWFFQHFTRMGGSYIATFTAALVTNIGRILPPDAPAWTGTIGWIAPSIVGGMLIGRTVRYYKQKFNVAKAELVA